MDSGDGHLLAPARLLTGPSEDELSLAEATGAVEFGSSLIRPAAKGIPGFIICYFIPIIARLIRINKKSLPIIQ